MKVSELERYVNSISVNDRDAVFILLGSICDGENGYAMLQWMMSNITPNGKYQAILSKDGDKILQWYYQEYLPWYSLKKPDSEFPSVARNESYLLYHALSLKHKEIVEIVKFYESLPITKELHTNYKGKHHVYYCIESWLTDPVLMQLKKPPIDKYELRCLKEYCLYYPPSEEEYFMWQGFYVVRPEYKYANNSRGYSYGVNSNQGLHCFCVDNVKFLI